MKNVRWGDLLWAISMAARGGLLVAMPVLMGITVGFILDRHFGTLPFISLALTAIGGIIGPVILYRWVVAAVKRRVGDKD
jgi:F0F1-type ATP synthase assembly protein I